MNTPAKKIMYLLVIALTLLSLFTTARAALDPQLVLDQTLLSQFQAHTDPNDPLSSASFIKKWQDAITQNQTQMADAQAQLDQKIGYPGPGEFSPTTEDYAILNPTRRLELQNKIAGNKAAIDIYNKQIALAQGQPPEKIKELANTASQSLQASAAAGQQLQKSYDNNEPEIPECSGWTDVACGLLKGAAYITHGVLLPLAGWALSIANIIFNQVFQETVRQFADYGKSGAVRLGWTVARDLVNLSLIFVLLYAAIGLILNLKGEHKKLVTSIVVVALLVNFSAFLTGLVIDASNIVSNQFYAAAGGNNTGNPTVNEANAAPDIVGTMTQKITASAFSSKLLDEVKNGERSPTAVIANIIISDLTKIPLFLITIVVLGAAAIMFIIRMFMLIFLIVLSPLAFLARAINRKQWEKWLSHLFNNAIFGPAFLFMFLITVKVASGNGPLNNFGKGSGTTDLGFANNLVYAIIVNGMMIAALVIAKHFGAVGADFGLKQSRKLAGGMTVGLAGRLGRNTIGRGASRLSENENLKERAKQGGVGGWVARQQLRAYGGLAKSSFDARAINKDVEKGLNLGKAGGKGGFEQGVKNQIERRKTMAEQLGPSEVVQNRIEDNIKEKDAALKARQTELASRIIRAKELTTSIADAEREVTLAPNPQAAAAATLRINGMREELRSVESVEDRLAIEKQIEDAQTALTEAKKDEDIGKRRQQAYADYVEAGGFGSSIFKLSTKKTRLKSARAIRAEATKTKSQKENANLGKKLAKLLEESGKEKPEGDGKEKEKDKKPEEATS